MTKSVCLLFNSNRFERIRITVVPRYFAVGLLRRAEIMTCCGALREFRNIVWNIARVWEAFKTP